MDQDTVLTDETNEALQHEAALAMRIGVLNGAVVLDFGKPVKSIGLAPDQALALANNLRGKANQVKNQVHNEAVAQKAQKRREARSKR